MVSLFIDGVQFVKSHVTLRYVYIHWLCLVTYGRLVPQNCFILDYVTSEWPLNGFVLDKLSRKATISLLSLMIHF